MLSFTGRMWIMVFLASVFCCASLFAEDAGKITVTGKVFTDMDEDSGEVVEVGIEDEDRFYFLVLDKASKEMAVKMSDKFVTAVIEKKVTGEGDDEEVSMTLVSYKAAQAKVVKKEEVTEQEDNLIDD